MRKMRNRIIIPETNTEKRWRTITTENLSLTWKSPMPTPAKNTTYKVNEDKGL